jgi:sulfite exporter TauE/SafE
VGNINGFLTKEWKGASKRSMYWIAAGIIILIIGVSILAKGNFMHGEYEKRKAAPVENSLSDNSAGRSDMVSEQSG